LYCLPQLVPKLQTCTFRCCLGARLMTRAFDSHCSPSKRVVLLPQPLQHLSVEAKGVLVKKVSSESEPQSGIGLLWDTGGFLPQSHVCLMNSDHPCVTIADRLSEHCSAHRELPRFQRDTTLSLSTCPFFSPTVGICFLLVLTSALFFLCVRPQLWY
jgi:hypothetical protein